MRIKLNRIAAGWYATPDGKWAIVGDDPDSIPTKAQVEADENAAPLKPLGSGVFGGERASLVGCATQREWMVVYDRQGRLRENSNDGENVQFFDTKREAQAWLDDNGGKEPW